MEKKAVLYTYFYTKSSPFPSTGISKQLFKLKGTSKAIGVKNYTGVQSKLPPWDDVNCLHLPAQRH